MYILFCYSYLGPEILAYNNLINIIQTALNPQLFTQRTASTSTELRLISRVKRTIHSTCKRREDYLSDEDLLLGLDLLLLPRGHLLQLGESELYARIRHLQRGRDKGQRQRRRDRWGWWDRRGQLAGHFQETKTKALH